MLDEGSSLSFHNPKLSLEHTVQSLDTNDKIVEGLRIPANLDSNLAVNFVITQEPGKLKPKDLKIAIEKNRAEREFRAEEQRKLREAGGGGGVLDLRGILAEEQLNANNVEKDPFQRQLREMAFLADVEEVEKQDIEKEFRISEDFLGANLLSNEDIHMIYRQREMTRVHQLRSQWRYIHSRQANGLFPPNHLSVKAGPSLETTQALVKELTPAFDPNRNDIWSKRLNTLRRFISIVSKWLVQKRLKTRMNKVKKLFQQNNCFTRDEIRAFIQKENDDNKASPSNTNGNGDDEEEQERKRKMKLAMLGNANTGVTFENTSVSQHSIKSLSLADILFSEKHPNIIKYQRNEEIIRQAALQVKRGEAEITTSMARRHLFPIFDRESLKFEQTNLDLNEFLSVPLQFDDRTFYHLKSKPEYITLNYEAMKIPTIPIDFPAATEKEKRIGAFEESISRVAQDVHISTKQLHEVGKREDDIEFAEITLLRKQGEAFLRQQFKQRLHDFIEHGEEDGGDSEHGNSGVPGSGMHGIVPIPELDMIVDDVILEPDLVMMTENTPTWLSATYQYPPPPVAPSSSTSATAHEVTPTVPTVTWRERDLDYFTVLPTYRAYNPTVLRSETDSDWYFRPTASTNTTNLYHQDHSLRNQWSSLTSTETATHRHPAAAAEVPSPVGTIFEGSAEKTGLGERAAAGETKRTDSLVLSSNGHGVVNDIGGSFLSVNYYLLGQAESRWRDDFIPPVGPTLLTDYYSPDHDRHISGLHCYLDDNKRAANEWDHKISGLQHQADPQDYLTDSESDNDDNEEDIAHNKITIQKVRKMLVPPPPPAVVETAPAGKGGKDAKKPASPRAAPAPTTTGSEGFDILPEDDKKETQVELLRDRKTLDLESTWNKSRKKLWDAVSKRLVEVSKESNCIVQALPVTLPYHQYEDETYKTILNHQSLRNDIPEVDNHHVELDPRLSMTQMPSMMSLMTSPASPERK